MKNRINESKVIEILSIIYNLELNGVVRYTHYSLMIFRYNRLPLVDFFRAQANESLRHAEMAGEHITGLDGHPPLNTGNIQETNKHDVGTCILIPEIEFHKICQCNNSQIPKHELDVNE